MPVLTPEIVDQVAAACQTGSDEAAEAFSRALDAQFSVAVGEPGTIDVDQLPDDLAGPGLAIVLICGESAALVLLAESTGLVPNWCADPDPTGESKLSTLAQELGMILLPEEFMPDDFKTATVKHLGGAARRGGLGDGAAIVPLELCGDGGKSGTASLVWPAPKPAMVIGSAKPQAEKTQAPAKQQASKPEPAPRKVGLRDLPQYSRSLLRIKVPVVVNLAEKRQPIGRIVELGPGSIIQFDKSCEEMLEMNVGDRPVATGEAVKVGDKFGLRITSVVLPEERFNAIRPG